MSSSIAVATGTIATVTLLDPETVLALGTNVEQELTVLRIVGQVGVLPAGALASSYGMGVLKLTRTVTPVFGGFADPLLSAELVDRDWMRIMSGDFNINSAANGLHERIELDIKVRRRLKGDESVRLIISNAAAGGDLTITIDVRILIVIRA